VEDLVAVENPYIYVSDTGWHI